jgi:hypothetical protein
MINIDLSVEVVPVQKIRNWFLDHKKFTSSTFFSFQPKKLLLPIPFGTFHINAWLFLALSMLMYNVFEIIFLLIREIGFLILFQCIYY